MKLKDFGILIRTIGFVYLFILLVIGSVKIPISIVILLTIGYLCSAVSCTEKLFAVSIQHHKLVNYFIGFLGIIVITKHFMYLRNM
jgi:hypothetical protein